LVQGNNAIDGEYADLSDCWAARPLKPSTESTAPDDKMLQFPPRSSVLAWDWLWSGTEAEDRLAETDL